MDKKLIPEFQKELNDLKSKMLKAQKFAEKLQIFSRTILEYKFSGGEHWLEFGKNYKSIYLAWGIRRGFFDSNSDRRISNCKADHQEYLFSIYINSLSLFDTHHNFGLYEALKGVDIFFSDVLNTTFYVKDEHIEHFLNTLNDWYLDARKQNVFLREQERIEKAEKELKAAREALSKAKGEA